MVEKSKVSPISGACSAFFFRAFFFFLDSTISYSTPSLSARRALVNALGSSSLILTFLFFFLGFLALLLDFFLE